jgi:hypothetical protein
MGFAFSFGVSLGQDSIEVHATLTSKSTPTRKNLEINILIVSKKSDTIIIPKGAPICNIEDKTAFFALELQRFQSGKFVAMSLGNFDNLPIVDADTLTIGSERQYEIPIGWLAEYPVSKYRIRVLALISLYNKTSDVYSNWVDFEVNNP